MCPLPRKQFHFPSSHQVRPSPLIARAATIVQTPSPLLIQGIPVGSQEEYNAGRALDILGYRYHYQYAVDYGRQRRGGQVLDFLVYTPIRWTVLDVRGTYWHTGRREDSLDIERVVRRHHWRLVVAWDRDVPSLSQAITFLRFSMS